ncbi:MAG: c-type cytochrome biogenesis protein CcmI [Burkholderiales bacterium]|nr:c-type cytochrome biogenesis protein CcmI [Burkholderiales bacterium]
MIVFAILAGLMCAGVCAYVLRGLLWPQRAAALAPAVVRAAHAQLLARRAAEALDAEAFARERAALAHRVLDAYLAPPPARPRPGAVAVLLLFVPLLAVPVYWAVGTPAALLQESAAPPATREAAVAQMRERVAALEARLAAEPGDGRGWAVLGQAYAALGEYARAAQAFAKAEPLLPADAQLLADYADALAMAQDRKLAGQPVALLERALKADPDNIKALLLAGTAAFEAGDYARALALWERVPRLAPQDAELIAQLQRSIDEARAKLAGAAPAAAAPAPAAAGLSGRVSLARSLADRAAPEDTVFIFARAASGPRMPLAALKLKVRDLPAEFRLDDSMAMAPGATLSQAGLLVVTARVSKSGDPIARPGDLEGASAPVKPGTQGLALEIGAVVQ